MKQTVLVKAGAMKTLISSSSPHRSLVIGGSLFVILLVAGGILVPSFFSVLNIRSMLVFASFLGLVALGQTLCALVGGLDLSIPFVIGGANIGVLWMIGKGVSSALAVFIIIVVAALVGIISGLISYRLQGQSLVVTLGVGYIALGIIQIVSSRGQYMSGGTIIGAVPKWLARTTAVNSNTFGLPITPVVVIWIVIAIAAIVLMRRTWVGRGIYGLGGNPTAARRNLVSEQGIWITVFSISGALSGLTGALLLGYAGGAYFDIGQPYLFLTVASVVVGGTALIGGRGGYPQTLLGVAILTVLQTVLVGVGLSTPIQQTILGLLIIPMVALYARGPHPRLRI